MKKTTPTSYARAFIEVLDQNPKRGEKVMAGLLGLIRKQGDSPRLAKIVEACERTWRTKNNRPLVTIESARTLGQKERATLEAQFPKGHDFKEMITPELIAGVRMSVDGTREIDGSLAKILRQIFAN